MARKSPVGNVAEAGGLLAPVRWIASAAPGVKRIALHHRARRVGQGKDGAQVILVHVVEAVAIGSAHQDGRQPVAAADVVVPRCRVALMVGHRLVDAPGIDPRADMRPVAVGLHQLARALWPVGEGLAIGVAQGLVVGLDVFYLVKSREGNLMGRGRVVRVNPGDAAGGMGPGGVVGVGAHPGLGGDVPVLLVFDHSGGIFYQAVQPVVAKGLALACGVVGPP